MQIHIYLERSETQDSVYYRLANVVEIAGNFKEKRQP